MTVYLDTSSIVKLFFAESGSDEVRQDLSDAYRITTSAVAYPEARSTFSRLRREGLVGDAAYRDILRDFEMDWQAYVVIEPTMAVCRIAGDLAAEFGLRGCDSVHLASYLDVARDAGVSNVRFSTFDSRLNRAAVKAVEGLM